ncbi:Cilia- and flagella-associated protein 73 [Quaeritorhiza haematococci]|nr:Cilia- and flagella-associated protein 73 [Quaeritorhiza haematococci]
MFESKRTLQSTLLLQKKKEMQQVQAQLEKKRIEFAKRMEECRGKQEELRAKQKQIRDRVIKFEKFLKENDAKRQRANLKAATERKLREQKEQELANLARQLQEEQLKTERIMRMIKKYQVYERYLQSVVDILPPDYLDVNEPHINDILMRHKTLEETNEDLIRSVQKSQDDIEKEQGVLAALIKAKNDTILVYNSTLGTQQKKLDKLKQQCAYLESKLEQRDRTGKERMRVLSEAKLAIDNLYDRVTNRGRTGHFAPNSLPLSLTNASQLTTTMIETNPSGVSGGGGGNPGTGAGGGGSGNAHVPLGLGLGASGAGSVEHSAKILTEKLHAIQERVLDLMQISAKAEQYIAQEHSEKSKLSERTTTKEASFPYSREAKEGTGTGNAAGGGGAGTASASGATGGTTAVYVGVSAPPTAPSAGMRKSGSVDPEASGFGGGAGRMSGVFRGE